MDIEVLVRFYQEADAPCRYPESMFHSLEGYGFDVHLLAEAAGIKYNNGPNTVTYFGAVLL